MLIRSYIDVIIIVYAMYVSEGPEVAGKSRVQDERLRCLSGGAYAYTVYTCKFTFIFHVRGKKKHCARLSIYVRNNNFCATQSLRKTRLKTSIILCTSYNIILRSVSISLEIRIDHITNI